MDTKSILLVDDEEMFLKTLETNLAHEGYEVTLARNGRSAIARLKERQYDLVMTDLVMEDVDGLHVLKEAKTVDPELFVMILTGHADLASAIHALRLGADDYLCKPCDVDDMLLRISCCLSRQRPEKANRIYGDILPMCSVCKRVREYTGKNSGEGRWISVEEFMLYKDGIMVTHSYCPDCRAKTLSELLRATDGEPLS
jgi:DNA-binding response OmpR family regulator